MGGLNPVNVSVAGSLGSLDVEPSVVPVSKQATRPSAAIAIAKRRMSLISREVSARCY